MISSSLLSVFLPVLIIILVGKLVSLCWLKDTNTWNSIDQLNFRLLIPCLVISTLISNDTSALKAPMVATIVIGSLGLIAFVTFVFYRTNLIKHLNPSSFSSVFQTSTRWNSTVALVVVSQWFGESYLVIVALMMAMFMPLANILNISMLVHLNNNQKSVTTYLSSIVKNPIVIACLLGIAISYFKVELPQYWLQSIDRIGDASISIALISLGAGLSLKLNQATLVAITTSCFFKLFLMPVTAVIFALLFGAQKELAFVMALSLAAPTAMNGYVVAKEMGGDAPLYASISSAQTLLSFITIPVWIALMSDWFS